MLEQISAAVEEIRPGRKLFVRRVLLTPRPRSQIPIEYTTDPYPKFSRTGSRPVRRSTTGVTTAKHHRSNFEVETEAEELSPCNKERSPGGGDPGAVHPNGTRLRFQKLPLNLVCVHGLCGTQQYFDPLLESLSERLDGLELKHSERTVDGEKIITQTMVEIHCLLFDMVGCGESPPPIRRRRKNPYAKSELMADLREVMEKYYPSSEQPGHAAFGAPTPTVFVGHSYGPSIFLSMLAESIKEVQKLKKAIEEEFTTSTDQSQADDANIVDGVPTLEENKTTQDVDLQSQELPQTITWQNEIHHRDLVMRFNVQGIVMLSSAIRTRSLPYRDGGTWAVRLLPTFALRCVNAKLTLTFVEAAVLDSHTEVRQLVKWQCQSNNLRAAQSHHANTQWSTAEELRLVVENRPNNDSEGKKKHAGNRRRSDVRGDRIPVLIAHGFEDGIIPMSAGQELAHEVQKTTRMRFVSLERSSHMGLMEEPEQVGNAIIDFIKHKVIPPALVSLSTATAAAELDDKSDCVLEDASTGTTLLLQRKAPPPGCCRLECEAC